MTTTDHLFSPLRNRRRVYMQLDDADSAKVNKRGAWRAEVTDQRTGRRYEVAGAPCCLPHCYCDAVVLRRLLP